MVIWHWTIQIARKETHCHHIGYSFQLPARVLLYAPSLLSVIILIVDMWFWDKSSVDDHCDLIPDQWKYVVPLGNSQFNLPDLLNVSILWLRFSDWIFNSNWYRTNYFQLVNYQGVMGRQIHPSIEQFQTSLSAPQLVKQTSLYIYYVVCGIVHWKDPLLLIGRIAHEVMAPGFL